MKFFVDAQLPPSLKLWLIAQGHICVHALDLPNKDLTPDRDIVDYVIAEGCVLMSKDADFLKFKLLTDLKFKLLILTMGNVKNSELKLFFEKNLDSALRLLETFEVVELGNHFVSGRNLGS